MSFLGNLLWLIFGGWIVGLLYLIGSILFFPVIYYLFPIATYAFWPFGRKPVSRAIVEKYKTMHPELFEDVEEDRPINVPIAIRRVLGTIWFLTFGWILGLTCIVAGLINLCLCVFLITIPICLPNAMGYFKLAKVSFVPFTVRIVKASLADEIETDAKKMSL